MNWFKGIKKYVINSILLLSGIVVACCIAEIGVRVIGFPSPTPIRYYYKKTNYGYDIRPNFPEYTISLRRNYSYSVWSNEIGCFDCSIKQLKDNQKSILLLGDSFTWGYTDFKNKWGTIIEQFCKLPVLKCGVPGFGTKQEYMKGKKLLKQFNIQTIIVGYYINNDLMDDYLYPSYTVLKGYPVSKIILDNPATGNKTILSDHKLQEKMQNWAKYGDYLPDNPDIFDKIKAHLKQNSRLYNCIVPKIKYIIQRLHIYSHLNKINIARPVYYGISFYNYNWLKNAWNNHLKNILAFKNLAEINKKRLLFILIPFKAQVYPELFDCAKYIVDKNKIDLNRPNKILRSFFHKHNISYLDLLPLFRYYARKLDSCTLDSDIDLYWQGYDEHWNVKGNHLAGLLVSKYILKHNIVIITDKQNKLEKIDQQLIKEFGKLPPENLL